MRRKAQAGEEPSRQLPKLDVAGSSPVSRSIFNHLRTPRILYTLH